MRESKPADWADPDEHRTADSDLASFDAHTFGGKIALDLPLRSGMVSAEGDLDFRGTLGVDKAAPVGFREIRLAFDLDSDASPDQLDTLMKLTERYCVVFQTLNQRPSLKIARRVKGG